MNEKIKQNALSQKMGDIYHYYIAIKFMLENNEWDKCIIEQYGDIVLLNTDREQIYNIEVKHHIEEKELKVYEEEFQKTLSNWFDIRNLFNNDTRLILLTSSIVSKDNALEYWNSFTIDKKYKVLINNQRKNSKDYYAKVIQYFHKINKNVDDLKGILEKFEIVHSLPNNIEIKSKIKDDNYFRIFEDNEVKKDKVLDELYGLIGSGLQNKDKWEITKKQFDQKLKEFTTLIQEKIIRTDTSISRVEINTEEYKEKQFIKKLDNIEFKENIFQLAIDDYAKTTIELIERMDLKTSLEYDERLSIYEDSLIKLVDSKKVEYEYKSDLTDIQKSQGSYFSIMNSNKIPFMPEEFDDKTTFFQKGYLHILADDKENSKQICWSLKPKDLK